MRAAQQRSRAWPCQRRPSARQDLAHGRAVELRWEIFNLFNRTNFDLPNRTFGTANFGRIFSAKNPREMQIGVRLTF